VDVVADDSAEEDAVADKQEDVASELADDPDDDVDDDADDVDDADTTSEGDGGTRWTRYCARTTGWITPFLAPDRHVTSGHPDRTASTSPIFNFQPTHLVSRHGGGAE